MVSNVSDLHIGYHISVTQLIMGVIMTAGIVFCMMVHEYFRIIDQLGCIAAVNQLTTNRLYHSPKSLLLPYEHCVCIYSSRNHLPFSHAAYVRPLVTL